MLLAHQAFLRKKGGAMKPTRARDQGILPIDSLKKLQDIRGSDYLDVNLDQRLDWDSLRARIKQEACAIQCPGDRADCHDSQYHRRLTVH